MIIKKVTRVKSQNDSGKEVGTGICIELENGTEIRLAGRVLRSNCPCATCIEERAKNADTENKSKRSSLLRVIKSEASEQLDLTKIWPVGNYALGLRWADGHDTGIYPFSVLMELSDTDV